MGWGRCDSCGHPLEVLFNVPSCTRCCGASGSGTAGDECGPYYTAMSSEMYATCMKGETIECVVYLNKDDALDFIDNMSAHDFDVRTIFTFRVPSFEYNDIYCGVIAPIMFFVHDRKPAVWDEDKTFNAWLLHKQ